MTRTLLYNMIRLYIATIKTVIIYYFLSNFKPRSVSSVNLKFDSCPRYYISGNLIAAKQTIKKKITMRCRNRNTCLFTCYINCKLSLRCSENALTR